MNTDRKRFIAYFIKHISSLRYVFLKYIATSSDEIAENSDIDILIDKRQLYRILEIIRAGSHINQIHIQQKSFVSFVSIHFEDQSYLELDLITSFDRKGIVFLQSKEVLQEARINSDGIKIPALGHHFEYIMLFYLLNNSSADPKYLKHFASYSFEERAAIFAHVRPKYDFIINTLDELLVYQRKYHLKVLEFIQEFPENKGFKKLLHKFNYVGDFFNDLFNNHGIIITFSGVDGAGKSTVLAEVKNLLQTKYRQKIVVIRHRPSLFPIISALRYGKRKAEEISVSQLPRQGKNRNPISSFFRFLYYYADYIVGQFYVYIRYTLRGYTVLYDRYYFDFIIDARRSNISLSRNFMRMGYNFVFKPEVNFFLYASPEIIHQRKQELNIQDIKQLTDEYQELFSELGKKTKKRKYISINNVDIQKTLTIVMNEYMKVS